MAQIGFRILNSLKTNKVGLSMFGVLVIGTAALVMNPVLIKTADGASKTFDGRDEHGVRISATLSQTKLIQGGSGEVYVTMSIQSPTSDKEFKVSERGTDLVVVLDRSGSMSTPEKFPYAKKAVKELLTRIGEKDRFSLVSFSDSAVIEFPLSEVSGNLRQRIAGVVDSVPSGGGTNIHAGVDTAWKILQQHPSSRLRKVVLLSDGQATSGDTSVTGLNRIASMANQQEAMLSTIGMGLGFNERVMSSMADNGMGRFSYLESLEQLGAILAEDLDDAKQTFATNSFLRLKLLPGMQLIDAGGYPITKGLSGTSGMNEDYVNEDYVNEDYVNEDYVNIATGRLLSSATKSFVLTVRVQNSEMASYDLSDMSLAYTVGGKESVVAIPAESLQFAVIAPERKKEAVASIDSASFTEVWKENNVGRLRQSVNAHLRKGDKDQAKSVITSYREQVQAVENASGVALYDSVVGELDDMDKELEEAFIGSAPEQKVKQNRLAKKSHADSRSNQRKMAK